MSGTTRERGWWVAGGCWCGWRSLGRWSLCVVGVHSAQRSRHRPCSFDQSVFSREGVSCGVATTGGPRV